MTIVATMFYDSFVGEPDKNLLELALQALKRNNAQYLDECERSELTLIRDVERKERIKDIQTSICGKDAYAHFPQFIVVKHDDAELIAQVLSAVSFMEFYYDKLVPEMEMYGEYSEYHIYVRWKLRYCPNYQIEMPIAFYDNNEDDEREFSANNEDDDGEVIGDEGDYLEAIWVIESAIERLF